MAIAPIKSIAIIGLMSELDKVVKFCGTSGFFHPDDASNFYSKTSNFSQVTDKNPYSDLFAEIKDIFDLASIQPYEVDIDEFVATRKDLANYTDILTSNLGALIMKKSECEQKIEQCMREISETTHFLGVDLQLDKIENCKYIKTNFGRLPIESFQKLETDNDNDNPYLIFFPCTSDKTHYWGMYISPIDKSEEIDRIFSSLYFEHYEISNHESSPEERYEKLNKDLVIYKQDLEKATLDVDNFIKNNIDECMKYYTKIEYLNICYNIKNYVLKYHNNFILVGWIPQEHENEFTKKLSEINSVEFTLSDGKSEIKHSPPVKLKNNFFAKPFEFFIDMYGVPCYNEIDPTLFVSITFTILFGIMFGDLGQGVFLSIVGYFMWKFKEMAIGKILIPCGISSAIFGLVYGSVFGFEHALDPLYHALGMAHKPIEVMESATTLILMAIAIGVILILIAMILNIYSALRRKDYETSVFGASGIAGLVFYSSLIIGLVCQLALSIPIMNIPYIIFLMILPLTLILFREPLGRLMGKEENWKPEKWGDYIVQNMFELFETLLSYVTNTMSFLRVGAFVLVHAGMMLVVFTISDLANQIAGFPGYVVCVIFGNLFVIALEALLVCIQVLRLEYYELFSRFYIGAGRKFAPVMLGKKTNI